MITDIILLILSPTYLLGRALLPIILLATVDIIKMGVVYTAFRDKVASYKLSSYQDIWELYVVKSSLLVYEKWYGYKTEPDIKRNYCTIRDY